MHNINSGKVAEVYHSETANYANVDQYQFNGSATQYWQFNFQYYDQNLNPVVTIVNVNSGKCMEVYHSQTGNYANVDQYQCNLTNTQGWHT
jgi:serine/threonine-protein kinase RIO1